MFISLFLYFPNFTSSIANPDAIWDGMIVKSDYSWEIASGRFGLALLSNVFGYVVSPHHSTIIGLFFVYVLGYIFLLF